MRKIFLAALLGLIASPAFAQVCPVGSTCNPLETYFYGQGTASPPYSSSLKIPVMPSASASAAQNIIANTLLDTTSTQTAAGKTFSSPTLSGSVTLSGITGSTQCLQVNTSGVIAGSGGVCGGGGGSGTVASSSVGTIPVYTAATTVTGTSAFSFASGLLKVNGNAAGGPAALAGSLVQILGADATNPRLEIDSFGGQSRFDANCYAGTGASPTAVGSGVSCGGHDSFAYNGTALNPLGGFRWTTAQVQSAGNSGGAFFLSTTPNATTSAVDRMEVANDGGIMVPPTVTGGDCGTGCINAAGLQVNGVPVAAGGSGSVGSGTAPQAAYYQASGTAVIGNSNITYQSGFTRLNYTTSGTAPTQVAGSVFQAIGPDSVNARVGLNSFAGISKFDANCFGGTSASPTAVGSGVQCGGFDIFAWDGTSLSGAIAGFHGTTAEAQTSSHHGGNLFFTTVPNLSTTGVDRMEISNAGGMMFPPTVAGGDQGVGTINAHGLFVDGVAVGGGGTPGGSSGQTQYNNSGAFGGYTMSGSCTITTSSGVIACPLAGTAIQSWSASGNTAKIVTQGAGAITSGHQLVYDVSGNAIDGGAPGSGGTVTNIATTAPITGGPITTTGTLALASNGITNALAAQMGANTLKGNPTGSTANASDIAMPSCPDSGGNHLNWVSGTGPTCGTSGGGSPVTFYGTVAGGPVTYTIASPTPTGFTATAGYAVRGQFSTSNGANPTLNINSTGAKPIVVNTGAGTTAAIGPGAIPTTSTAEFILDSTAANWVLQTPVVASAPITGTHAVTVQEWNACQPFIIQTAAQTITIPDSTTLASGGCIVFQTVGVSAALAPGSGSDGFNGNTAGSNQLVPPGITTVVTTSGAHGVNAFAAPLGPVIYFPIAWAEGLNFAGAARYMGRVQNDRLLIGVKCNVQTAMGVTGHIDVYATASGTAPGSGTKLDTTACDANVASNTEQDMGVAVTTIPANYTVWAVATGTWTSSVGNGGINVSFR